MTTFYPNTLILVLFNINVFLLPVLSSVHSEWPAKTSLYSESKGTFRFEIETNLEDLLINIKQKYADDNELIFSENYEKLRNLDSNRLKKIFLSVSDKFLNSIDIRFDRKSAKLSIRSINIIDNFNIKEARKSILILEVKAPYKDNKISNMIAHKSSRVSLIKDATKFYCISWLMDTYWGI